MGKPHVVFVALVFTFPTLISKAEQSKKDWIRLSQSVDGNVTNYLEHSLEGHPSSRFVGATMLADYKSQQTTKSGKGFYSCIENILFRCGEKLYSPISVKYFSGAKGAGKITEQHERSLEESSKDLYEIQTNSAPEVAYNLVCSRAGLSK